ncbi:MAG: crotonase/enoyl-CoA hydratase family protein [Bacteroidia bacterium]|nr:crotonase/enoyl-CoA hydratase family protein [Bacteroidia bacterium]
MQNIKVEKRGRVTIILIDRPEARNAVDRITAEGLSKAFYDFDQDQDADVAVLGGTNGYFCAGADLKAVAGHGARNRAEPDGDGPMGPSRMLLSKPVIAAVAGYAVAGGLELACWCDLRVVEASAMMGVFCRRWGVPLIDGGTVRLPRLIGQSRAMDMILTGREIGAEEALQWGLANRIVPDGEAVNEAIRLAESLTHFPQTCMRNDRLSAYQQWDLDMENAIRNEFELGIKTIQSNETFEGASRFASGKGRHGDFENI